MEKKHLTYPDYELKTKWNINKEAFKHCKAIAVDGGAVLQKDKIAFHWEHLKMRCEYKFLPQ